MENKIGYINIKDVKRADYNPRYMPDNEMNALMESIRVSGFAEAITVNINPESLNVLVGGHQRLTAVERLISKGVIPNGILKDEEKGGYKIPAMFVDLTREQEEALNIGLNKISGRFDDTKLADLIFKLKDTEFIPATGFREEEVSRILDEMNKSDEEVQAGDPEAIETPRSKPGEVYQLGPHRLVCGDSTDVKAYELLFGEEKADMLFTDPPYNVAYKSKGANLTAGGKQSIKNDDMSPEDFDAFLGGVFAGISKFMKDGASTYVCTGWGSYPPMLMAMLRNAFQQSGLIVWVKNAASMGWNDYKYKYELIIYGWKNGVHTFYGDNETDVWEMPRKSTNNYLHPTEKPDWLCMRALRNSTKRNAIVLDTFGGSGSTMAAAHKVGRRAYMIELDPKFCDVIRDRWDAIEKTIVKL